MRNYDKFIRLFSLSIFFIFYFASCEKEELVGLAWLEAEVEGINLNNVKEAHIPSEGISFKIKVFKKGNPSSSVCLNYYTVDNNTYSPQNSLDYQPSDKPYFGSKGWLKGDWGQFEYVNISEEYTGVITIAPNLGNAPRYFAFFYMEGNGGYELKLIQAGVSK